MNIFTYNNTTVTYDGNLSTKIRIMKELFDADYEPTAEELSNDAKLQQARAAYPTILARLQQIQTVPNPTNAQVIQAVRDLAQYVEYLYQYERDKIQTNLNISQHL